MYFEDFNLHASSIVQKTCLTIFNFTLKIGITCWFKLTFSGKKTFTNQKYRQDLNITNNFTFYKTHNKIGKMPELDFS